MESFIKGFGATQNRIAMSIDVPPRRINDLDCGHDVADAQAQVAAVKPLKVA